MVRGDLINNYDAVLHTLDCPAGERVLSGGITDAQGFFNAVMVDAPSADGAQWQVQLAQTTTTYRIYAICAFVSS